ncbi:tRNA lysidine(34) synthetase TilS [Sphingomonas glacialis]|uniref:tRNA(Ile)-lysidine synthase n=1 Tax=Sphingomonas glacialis TaxID=658225 RepID=A0A502G3Z6_9SPHN|nr:tRNA lysidine(34) synthetase TilS [Sphingomonas glacialis]TPG56628.1 tRNA lysidine(34) synthetase TilS [Sphingomonas glacialis]
MNAADRVPVEPALVARFRHDFERARPLAATERLALAVSGGPDSMALLALAVAAFPGQIIAATVDHRLRPAAADEARMVADWCDALSIAHTTLVIDAPIGTSAVQGRARDRRYALLFDWATAAGAVCLATAHHADDQAETFLMRAARGAGVAGLGGIRAYQQVGAIALIRPLLDWRVAELRALAVTHALPFVDDPSNGDPHYERTRFRALLRDTPWLDPVQIARAATHAAEADATIRGMEDWLWQTRRRPTPNRHPGLVPGATAVQEQHPQDVRHSGCRDAPGMTGEGGVVIDLDVSDLPRELRRRLARRAIHAVRAAHAITTPAFTDSANIEPLLDSLEAGKAATHAGILVSVHDTVWNFAPQPPRRSL